MRHEAAAATGVVLPSPYISVQEHIRQCMMEFLDRHVIEERGHEYLPGMTMRKLMRACAKEMGKPDIILTRNYYTLENLRQRPNRLLDTLDLPNLKRLDPVVAALKLAGVKTTGRYGRDGQYVLTWRKRSRIEFNFFGLRGRELCQSWLERLRTDPEWLACVAPRPRKPRTPKPTLSE